MKGWHFAAALAALAFAGPGRAETLALGSLCIDGVRGQAEPGLSHTPEGHWQRFRYSFESGTGPGRLMVFDRAIPAGDAPENCDQTRARMTALGAKTLLAGRLTSLTMRARLFTATSSSASGNRLHVERGGLSVRMRTTSGGPAVAGGTAEFSNTRVELRNSEPILARATGSEGELRIDASTRRVAAARIVLPGGAAFVTDLNARGAIELRMDLASGITRIWAGTLEGDPSRPARGTIDLGLMSAEGAVIDARQVRLDADEGRVELAIAGLKGEAASLAIPHEKLAWDVSRATIEDGTIEGTGHQTVAALEMRARSVTGLALRSPAARLLAANGEALAGGDVRATFESVTAESLSVASNWTKLRSGPLEPILPAAGIEGLDLALSGSRGLPELSGLIRATRLDTGRASFAQALSIPIPKAALDSTIQIPIHLDLPAASGTIRIADGGQQALITGKVHRFYLHGDLVLPLADLRSTHLLVAPRNLRAGIGAAVATSPFVAGTKPNFGGVEVGLTNHDELRLSGTSSGRILLEAGALLLGQPVVKVGEGGTAQPLAITFTAQGGAKLLYDIAAGKAILAQIRARAENVDAQLLGTGSKTIDLNGTLITDPRLQLAAIEVEVDRLGTVAVEQASLTGLAISASRVERRRPAADARGLEYGGRPAEPISIAAARAAKVTIGDEIALDEFSIDDFRFSLVDGWADMGDGIRFADARVGLRVGKLTRSVNQGVARNQLTAAGLDVSGRFTLRQSRIAVNEAVPVRLRLELAGPEDALSGRGSFRMDPFTGHARSKLDIAFRCRNSPTLKVPFEYNFGVGFPVGGTELDAKLDDGRLSAEGQAGPITVIAHTTKGAECDSPTKKHVIAKARSGWTYGVCMKRWKVRRCKWKWTTPEIYFSYHIQLAVRFANLNAFLSNPRVRLGQHGELSVCNLGGVKVVAPAIIGGYTPQIERPFPPGSEKIVNALLAANFEAAQSVFATAAVNSVAWLISEGGTIGGNALCLGEPL